MNLLCNYPYRSFSASINFLYFGEETAPPYQYDYTYPFKEFLQQLPVQIDFIIFHEPFDNLIPLDIGKLDVPTIAFTHDPHITDRFKVELLKAFDWIGTHRPNIGLLNELGVYNTIHITTLNLNADKIDNYHSSANDSEVLKFLYTTDIDSSITLDQSQFIIKLASLSNKYPIEININPSDTDYFKSFSQSKCIIQYSLRGEVETKCFEAIKMHKVILGQENNQELPEILSPKTQYIPYEVKSIDDTIKKLCNNPEILESTKSAVEKSAYALDAKKFVEHLELKLIKIDTLDKVKKIKEIDFDHLSTFFWHAAKLKVSEVHFQVFQEYFQKFMASEEVSSEKLGTAFAVFRRIQRNSPDIQIIARKLYQHIGTKAKGIIWNTFNYALLLRDTNHPEEELILLQNILKLIGSARLNRIHFQGQPLLFPEDEAYELFHGVDDYSDLIKILPMLKSYLECRIATFKIKSSRLDHATSLLHNAIKHFPTNRQAYVKLFHILISHEQEKATQLLYKAFILNPLDSSIWTDLIKYFPLFNSESKTKVLGITLKALIKSAENTRGALDPELIHSIENMSCQTV